MTSPADQFAELRKALAEHVTFHSESLVSYDKDEWQDAAEPYAIRALLAERDALAAQVQAQPKSSFALDDNVALVEMAKHAHRALNAAANILRTVDEDMIGDESVEDVYRRCADIACSLFTILRTGNEVERYESAPFASDALPAAPSTPEGAR